MVFVYAALLFDNCFLQIFSCLHPTPQIKTWLFTSFLLLFFFAQEVNLTYVLKITIITFLFFTINHQWLFKWTPVLPSSGVPFKWTPVLPSFKNIWHPDPWNDYDNCPARAEIQSVDSAKRPARPVLGGEGRGYGIQQWWKAKLRHKETSELMRTVRVIMQHINSPIHNG